MWQIGCHDNHGGGNCGGKKDVTDDSWNEMALQLSAQSQDCRAFYFTLLLLLVFGFVRRASETEDGVRGPVIDITHFCSNKIGALQERLHALQPF